ncbi:hypothetical protein CSC70_13270 [Pseudoxanthomonas kalamensis DSM 18571]|uniref:hypothetical protein n=1 Tax=Pseudoxanthomonas kalamensis TaxID=289483 RepID=UPI0013913957|nr:hypothetical protein [Pseudoxanthomonas kalamensis]KAF1708108.1 hypothetical protein CSC70_13270 [Pseudoxanthomonas kalamensis DSM 18571]
MPLPARLLVSLCLSTLALTAHAAGVVRFHAQAPEPSRSGDFVVEYDDQGNARLSGGKRPGYLLLRGDQAYQVGEDGSVYDLKQVAGVLKQSGLSGSRRGGRFGGRLGEQDPQVALQMAELIGITPSGRKETVAGLEGEVYRAEYRGADGKTRQSELVLGKQPALRDFTRAMQRLGHEVQTRLGRTPPAGTGKLYDYLDQHGLGLLRIDQSLLLKQLDERTPAGDRFALPASPTSIDSLRDLRKLGGGRWR